LATENLNFNGYFTLIYEEPKKLNILDPESDEAVEATNDLMIYQNIIEKVNERGDV